MNAYKIKGTSNQVGAIGKPEPFERITTANNPREAYEQNRAYMYMNNREHVLTTEIQESKIAAITGLGAIGTQFHTIDPERYL